MDLSKHKPADAPAVTPPAWDPLGVAPFAWDLPEPAPAFPPAAIERKRRSRWTASFLGLALLGAAVTAAVGAASGGDWATAGRIGAVALSIIAVGLILGAFLRKGYGLLVVAAPLAGFVALATAIGPVDLGNESSGTQLVVPSTAAELAPSYDVGAGELNLDLTGLTLDESRTVNIDVALGSATVTVPDSMTVIVQCEALMGTCPVETRFGPATSADAPVLTIVGDVALGEVKVDQR